jgi:hypothetical protein
MANYARDVLRAIEKGDTAFELVPKATEDNKGEVEIFSPQEMKQLLLAAVESDLEILPVIVLQGFEAAVALVTACFAFSVKSPDG